MTIHAERAFFERLLPTGNSLVKKCPLMTPLERKYYCLHTSKWISASLLLLEHFYYAKITLKVKNCVLYYEQEKKGGHFYSCEVGFMKKKDLYLYK